MCAFTNSTASIIDKSTFTISQSDNNIVNNTIKVSSSSLSPSSNRNNATMIPCNDPDNGFSIAYPSNWTSLPGKSCIIFGPSWGQIFGNNDQTYIRISDSTTSSCLTGIPASISDAFFYQINIVLKQVSAGHIILNIRSYSKVFYWCSYTFFYPHISANRDSHI